MSHDRNIYPQFELDHEMYSIDPNSCDLIDWTEDVPHIRKHSYLTNAPFVWKPILPKMWKAALILNPNLKVCLKLKLMEKLTYGPEFMMINRSSVFQQLFFYWPVEPAPVSVISVVLTGEIEFLSELLFHQNRIAHWYSNTLTSVILYFEVCEFF